jgi:hypothetical protein
MWGGLYAGGGARGGGDLFIFDNSGSGWTGLRYLQERTELADRFDIATGYFEVGLLLVSFFPID